jgi:cell fate (sporulation/competence/biofilm development) regulator YlbF (YheA/YmcA/DUF963 family)
MENSVIKKAQELARTIAESREYQTMRAMDEESAGDHVLTALYSEYTEKHSAVEELTLADNPDYDAMGTAARELEELESRIQSMPVMQKLKQAREAFSDMMKQVNKELQGVLSPDTGCGSNCDSCGGCSH